LTLELRHRERDGPGIQGLKAGIRRKLHGATEALAEVREEVTSLIAKAAPSWVSRCHGIRQAVFDAAAFFGTARLPMQVLLELDDIMGAVSKDSLPAWRREIENDWGWCHPLSVEEPEHYAEFLARPLWEESRGIPPEWQPTVDRWHNLPMETDPWLARDIIQRHLAHCERGISWTDLQERLVGTPSQGDEAANTPTGPGRLSADAEALVGDLPRLATLVARVAMRERTRLKLAVEPAFIEFREAAAILGARHANELPELEKKLGGFVPNALWLAWIQTVHGPALGRLGQELSEWIEPSNRPDAAQELAPPNVEESNELTGKAETTPLKKKPSVAAAAKSWKFFARKKAAKKK